MRRELSRRPLLLAAASLALGLVFSRYPYLIALVPALIWLAEAVAVRLAVGGLALLGVLLAPPIAQPLIQAEFFEGEGRIITVPRIAGDGQAALIEAGGKRVAAIFPVGVDVSYGDSIQMRGVLRPIREGMEDYYLPKGVVARFEPSDLVRLREGPALLRWGLTWRDSFRTTTSRTLSPRSKKLADALCFNVESALDDDLEKNLRRTGTVHIVSASGLHVGIFAIFLQVVLVRLPIDRRWQLLLLMAILVAYVGAAGMRPPVVRAVLMAGVLLPAYLWRREPDLLSAMGLAAIVQLLWDPWSVLDPAFHLSFVAVVGLGLFVDFEPGAPGFVRQIQRRASQVAQASLVATLATAPIIGYTFGSVSVVAILANLMIAPLVAVVVPGALAAWALSWNPALESLAMMPVELSCRAIEGVVGWLGPMPFAAVDLPAYSAWWIPVYYLAMAGLWRKRVRPA